MESSPAAGSESPITTRVVPSLLDSVLVVKVDDNWVDIRTVVYPDGSIQMDKKLFQIDTKNFSLSDAFPVPDQPDKSKMILQTTEGPLMLCGDTTVLDDWATVMKKTFKKKRKDKSKDPQSSSSVKRSITGLFRKDQAERKLSVSEKKPKNKKLFTPFKEDGSSLSESVTEDIQSGDSLDEGEKEKNKDLKRVMSLKAVPNRRPSQQTTGLSSPSNGSTSTTPLSSSTPNISLIPSTPSTGRISFSLLPEDLPSPHSLSEPPEEAYQWEDLSDISEVEDSEAADEGIAISSSKPKKLPTLSSTVLQDTTKIFEEDRLQKRKNIAMEILTTERTFCQSLAIGIESYMNPLVATCSSFGESVDNIKNIFSNIEVLYNFNSTLLQEIEKIMADWGDYSVLGPVFQKMAPFLKMYTVYSNKYSSAIEQLNNLLSKNDKFANEVNNCRDKSGSQLKLPDLLIMPIQRIPRYSLLLSDLLKNTDSNHIDYQALSDSLDKITEVATHINEEVRRTENSRKIEQMQEKGIKLANIIKPHRYLIREGVLKVEVTSTHPYNSMKGVKEVYHLLLFNDIFIRIKKDQIKHESDLDRPQYLWPLMLLWLYSDNKKLTLYGPTETLSFIDDPTDNWAKPIEDAIKSHLFFKNQKMLKGESSKKVTTLAVRIAEFVYPSNQGRYKGDWIDGKRHGRGTFEHLGNKYIGGWKDDKQHGKGHFKYSNGDTYTGWWANGLQNGKGCLETASASKYLGYWAKGVREGKGKMSWADGSVYQGSWKNDRMHGWGELRTKEGVCYTGYWKDNLFDGQGRLSLPNGSIYDGEWKEGMKHGRGKLTYHFGAVYEGQFCEDMRQGRGVFTDIDNSKYDGEWVKDLQDGMGTKSWDDGSIYEGKWSKGLRSGRGKCSFTNGIYYEGWWEYDRRHGEGEFQDADKTNYKGTWARDFPEGRGILIFPNGAVYRGLFYAGKYHKTGTFTCSEFEYDGDWVHGKMSGKGFMKYQNGDSFKGSWKNGMYHGHGTLTFANGVSYEGKWTYGVKEGKASISVNSEFANPEIACSGFLQFSNMLLLPTGTASVVHMSPNIPETPFFYQSDMSSTRK